MKYIIGPMLAVLFAQLYVDGYYLAASAMAFITGLWCAWPQGKGATNATR